MPDKVLVQYRGDLGDPPSNFAQSVIDNPISDAAAVTFLTALDAHTDANISKRVYSTVTSMTGAAPGSGVNIDRKAVLYFRHPTTLRTHNFTVNAIVAADTEEVVGSEGERVTTAAMTAIIGDIETLTGIAFIPLYGVVIQSR
jgi:hypothetical protein